MSAPILELMNISKSFQNNQILKNVSFTVSPGEIVALVGCNGTGKSTLLNILARLELPDAGNALAFGRSIHDDDPAYFGDVGLVTETTDFSIAKPLEYVSRLLAKHYPRWDKTVFAELAAQFKLPMDRNFRSLSRGQRMQFAFAARAAARPRLLLLDEITSVLDPTIRQIVIEFLRGYAKDGPAIIAATNILTDVQPIADRMLILESGSIAMDCKVDNLEVTAEEMFLQFTQRAA